MQLGWIDFSKTERNKILSVLDLLSEPGTLDEVGIAPIRDGFSNLFFPGTSTIQTRAKYFFLVPYALKELELSSETNPNKILRSLNEIEEMYNAIKEKNVDMVRINYRVHYKNDERIDTGDLSLLAGKTLNEKEIKGIFLEKILDGSIPCFVYLFMIKKELILKILSS